MTFQFAVLTSKLKNIVFCGEGIRTVVTTDPIALLITAIAFSHSIPHMILKGKRNEVGQRFKVKFRNRVRIYFIYNLVIKNKLNI